MPRSSVAAADQVADDRIEIGGEGARETLGPHGVTGATGPGRVRVERD